MIERSAPGRRADHRRARWLVPPMVVALAFLSLTAFVYLPDTSCSDPVCVRQRYSVFLEVDAFRLDASIDQGPRAVIRTASHCQF